MMAYADVAAPQFEARFDSITAQTVDSLSACADN